MFTPQEYCLDVNSHLVMGSLIFNYKADDIFLDRFKDWKRGIKRALGSFIQA
jgi:hypothetical protein